MAFLRQIDQATAPQLDLHLIMDNSSTHKTKVVQDWLQKHPRYHLHFTPTSASWLNAVEGWFAQLQRRALQRGAFTSVEELKNEIRRFIEIHNGQSAKPFVWTKKAKDLVKKHQALKQKLLLTN